MKKHLLFLVLLFILQFGFSQTSYVWNGSTSTAWNTATNWTPNGIPGGNAGDNVTIVTGGNNCILNATTSITNLTITSGVLNLGGFTLNVTGVGTCNGGSSTNGTLNFTGTTLTFAGTTFGAVVNANVSDVYFNGSTFNGALTVTKNSGTNIQSTGNNIFNAATSITNAGTGYLLLTNNAARSETFNATLTLNTTNTGNIYIAYTGTTTFAANVTVNNTAGTGSVQFGRVGAGAVTLNNGFNITTGTFTGGTLTLQNFTQIGSTPLTLSPGINGGVDIYSATINGNLIISAGNIYTRSGTYAGTVSLTKLSGTNTNNMYGGNTFNSTLTVNYTSSTGNGYWGFAANAGDIYNADVYVNNNSLDRILWGVNAAAVSQFNGNLILTQIGSSVGMSTAWSASSGCTIAAGKTISIGAAGFNAGYLFLQGLTQNGNAAMNLTLTGSASLYVGEGASYTPSTFGGSFTATAPDIYLRGGIFNGAVVVTKTGGGNDHNNQRQNIFNSTLAINQQSSGGYFMLGYSSNDLFNDNITLTSTGTGGINLGWTGGTGTPTLAAGKTILIGGAGFSAGSLYLGTFTQLGNAAMNLTFTGASTSLTFARSSVIGGNLTTNTPDVFFNGCTFNGTVDVTKTGAGSDAGSGGNTFQSTANFTNSGAGYLLFGNGTADIWNGDVSFTNTGSERILPCWSSAGNQFNGNITVSNTGSGTGIEFCGGNASSSCTLAATKNIQIGAGGFNTGYLHLYRFTQLGNASSNLTLTGANTIIVVGPTAAIGGDFTVVSPRILVNGCTFSGNVNLTKNGAAGEWSNGGNTFGGTTTINQLGSGFFGFANGSPDIFNGDVYVNNNSTERVIFGNSSAGNQFNGNVILTQIGSSVGIAFGWNAATSITMAAGKTISIGGAGYNVGYLQIARFTQAGNAAMNLPLTGSSSLTFGPTAVIGGDVVSTSSSLFFNGSTFNGALDATKNGASNDASSGGNIFQGTTSFTNNGAGYLLLGNGTADTWNSDVTFTNTGAERILPCYNSAGNQFNGNIVFNSTGSSVGINFCSGSAASTATQAAGFGLSIGGSGFSAGYLILQRFTQLGNAATNLTMTASAGYLQFGPNSTLGGNVTSSSPGLFFNGCTFNGTVNSTKIGATSDNSTGSNIFNGVTTITTTSGQLLFGNGNADQFNAAATFNNNGTANLYVAYNSANNIFGGDVTFNNAPTANTLIYVSPYSAGTVFNGNIIVTSTAGQGVQFCASNATAAATLSATKTISVGGAGFSAGTLLLKQFTQVGPTAQALTLTGTGILTVGPSSAFGGDVNFIATQLNLNGCTYSGLATLEQNGATNSGGTGANIFNGTTIITNSGTGQFLTGNTNADQFNAATTFNNTGGYRFVFANNHGGQTTTFANTLTLNAAKTVAGDNWSFFACEGNNTNITFAGPVIVNCSGAIQSNCRFLNGTGSTAVYNGDVTLNLTNSAATQLLMGVNGTSTYNGNLVVTNSSGANGIYFNVNAGASSSLANTKTITIGAGGFSAGGLYLYRFTQVGNTAQSLTLTGTANLTFGPSSAFGGNVTCTSPTLYFNGCTYSGTLNATKNGTTNDNSSGNNIFNGTTTITNSGSGYLLFGNGNADQFNAASTFNNTGTNSIYVAYNSANNVFGGVTTFNNTPAANTAIYVSWLSTGTTFNNNIIVTSTFGQGVQFCGGNATASATLAAGNTISVGAGGFTTGTLLLRQFTQTGATAQNLTLTGAGNLTFGPSSAFGGNVTCTSPALIFNGCTFSGVVTATKNGASNDGSVGNNIFNGATTITNSGAGYLQLGNGNADQFNSTSVFNNTGSSTIYVADNSSNNLFGGDATFNNTPTANTQIFVSRYSAGTNFNGNIVVTSTFGQGVQFCSGNATASATLAAAKTISIGAGGFSVGTLLLKQFTQVGATAQSLTLTGTGNLTFGPASAFGGNVTCTSPTLLFNGCTYTGTLNATKNGTSNDQCSGGNTFNGSSTFTNSNTGYLRMAVTSADAYNGNVSFVQNSTGALSPSYNTNCTYAGNISITSLAGTAITFGSGASGISTMNGSGVTPQTISLTSGKTPVFTQFVMNNTGSAGVTLNTPVNISTSLGLTAGLLNTDATNLLIMLNGSTAPALTDASTSYVNGPLQYQKASAGASTLNFPVGTSPDCRPFTLTVNHSAATQYNYTAQTFNADANSLGYTLAATTDTISYKHYWSIDRTTSAGVSDPSTNLSGNQTVKFYFGTNDGVYEGTNYLTIVKNVVAGGVQGTQWFDIGGTVLNSAGGAWVNSGAPQAGSVTSTSSPSAFTSFSRFTLASKLAGWNSLPVKLLTFTATPNGNNVDVTWTTATEINNKKFTVERSHDGKNFTELSSVPSKAPNGNSTTKLDYKITDAKPLGGNSYYRLKQTDYNGKSETFNTVLVKFSDPSSITFNVYPNPNSGQFKVDFSGIENNHEVQISLTDEQGRIVYNNSFFAQETNNTVNIIPETKIGGGIYFCTITVEGIKHTVKVMVN